MDEPHETAPSNLPVLHNSFVGRTEELTRLVGLLDEAAIVTVVAGRAKGDLLDTYGAERAAVGRDVLAMTH